MLTVSAHELLIMFIDLCCSSVQYLLFWHAVDMDLVASGAQESKTPGCSTV